MQIGEVAYLVHLPPQTVTLLPPRTIALLPPRTIAGNLPHIVKEYDGTANNRMVAPQHEVPQPITLHGAIRKMVIESSGQLMNTGLTTPPHQLMIADMTVGQFMINDMAITPCKCH